MNLNKRAERLLHQLQEAIDEAIADSLNVLAAMSELEDAGVSPSLSVQVSLPEDVEPISIESVSFHDGLILTGSDEYFLRSVGITTPMFGQTV